MIVPQLLRPGDTVAITAPARKIDMQSVRFAEDLLSSWGLKVVLSDNLFSDLHPYFSGTDQERLHDLQEAINNPAVNAILCARGGYGSTRIVDQVDFTSLLQHPKWIIGFSDITALHLKLLKSNMASIHATMPILFSKSDSSSSVDSLKNVLMNGVCKIECSSSNLNAVGEVTGIVMGGNLSLLNDSLGTSTEPDTSGKILIIEEVDEYKYRVDRMMTQLKRAGKLKNLKALVVGHFTDIKDSTPVFGESVETIILNAVKEYSYPVVFNFPSGHENPNYAWINGGIATLTVTGSKTTLEYSTIT